MITTTHARLVCVLLLCALEETVLSQRGHCTGNQCFAFFQIPKDFAGAEKSCKDWGGELSPNLEPFFKILGTVPTGRYWIDLQSPDRSAKEALQRCPSIFVSNNTLQWEPCRSNLTGFLCQYQIQESCSQLPTGSDIQVKYTAPMNFEVDNSETFPLGTVAEAQKVGTRYLDTKYVCYSTSWLQAPWFCEVFLGGCEHNCNSKTQTCTCPAGKTLHPNNISCSEGMCEENPCTREGEQCLITPGGFECICKDGYENEDGVCVNVTICFDCEHTCEKFDGVYKCVCKKGFRVSPHNPLKCELLCTERDCYNTCISGENGKYHCFCANGYIEDIKNNTPYCTDIDECESWHCDQGCENLFGGFRCSCFEGYNMDQVKKVCVPIEHDNDGSGSPPPYPTSADSIVVSVPTFIKTGSVLGITVFMALCALLLFFLIRKVTKHSCKFKVSQFKHPDIDIFYLQQVTAETYKRLSFDKQSRNDS
ncbi:hypothetical protein PBY51_007105 [Eleginops maclovinus]|uniref:Thrombomodulin n=1 Tax=Eleginops maclovinus TaxID=56733 RepID=A0AAN7X192_ELEMC|nr:hypothetical protein PBY51_007105 [Eleginops maclovinus]